MSEAILNFQNSDMILRPNWEGDFVEKIRGNTFARATKGSELHSSDILTELQLKLDLLE